jgi:hypothetical protein
MSASGPLDASVTDGGETLERKCKRIHDAYTDNLKRMKARLSLCEYILQKYFKDFPEQLMRAMMMAHSFLKAPKENREAINEARLQIPLMKLLESVHLIHDVISIFTTNDNWKLPPLYDSQALEAMIFELQEASFKEEKNGIDSISDIITRMVPEEFTVRIISSFKIAVTHEMIGEYLLTSSFPDEKSICQILAISSIIEKLTQNLPAELGLNTCKFLGERSAEYGDFSRIISEQAMKEFLPVVSKMEQKHFEKIFAKRKLFARMIHLAARQAKPFFEEMLGPTICVPLNSEFKTDQLIQLTWIPPPPNFALRLSEIPKKLSPELITNTPENIYQYLLSIVDPFLPTTNLPSDPNIDMKQKIKEIAIISRLEEHLPSLKGRVSTDESNWMLVTLFGEDGAKTIINYNITAKQPVLMTSKIEGDTIRVFCLSQSGSTSYNVFSWGSKQERLDQSAFPSVFGKLDLQIAHIDSGYKVVDGHGQIHLNGLFYLWLTKDGSPDLFVCYNPDLNRVVGRVALKFPPPSISRKPKTRVFSAASNNPDILMIGEAPLAKCLAVGAFVDSSCSNHGEIHSDGAFDIIPESDDGNSKLVELASTFVSVTQHHKNKSTFRYVQAIIASICTDCTDPNSISEMDEFTVNYYIKIHVRAVPLPPHTQPVQTTSIIHPLFTLTNSSLSSPRSAQVSIKNVKNPKDIIRWMASSPVLAVYPTPTPLTSSSIYSVYLVYRHTLFEPLGMDASGDWAGRVIRVDIDRMGINGGITWGK